MRYNFKLIPFLIFLVCFSTTTFLGVWQIKRLDWKTNLIDKLSQRQEQETTDLSDMNLQNIDLQEWEYRKVLIEGEYLHDKEMHLYAGPRNIRGKPGYMLLTPLRKKDGQIIIINRGWIPESVKLQEERLHTIVTGTQIIEGTILKSEKQSFAIPDNDKKSNIWFYINIPEINDHINISNTVDDLFIMRKYYDEALPIGKMVGKEIYNQHLQYAITWFALAFSILVIYLISSFKRIHK